MKLKHSIVLLVAGLAAYLSPNSLAQTENDKAEVTTAVNGITTYFFSKDLEKFAKLWANDAVFITVGGIKAEGKDAIVDMHSMANEIVDDSTKTMLEPPVIRFLSEDLAIAYSVWGGLVFKFGGHPTPVQSGYLTAVLQKKEGAWKIVSATNALNFDNHQPYGLEIYTPDLWRKWGVPRPDGLPLSRPGTGSQ